MRRFLLLLGALAQTTMLVTADGLAKPASAAAVPLIDATVAVIPGGAVSADLGMQGIALNADRSLLYIGEGAKVQTYDPVTGSCTGTPPSSPRATGAVGIFDTSSRARVTDVPLAAGLPVHVELDSSTGRMYVVASPFGVYAFQGSAQVGSLFLDAVPHDLGIDSINGHAVVTNTFNTSQTWVSLIDLASLRVLANTNTGAFGPHKAASDSSRHLVYVAHA